MIQRNLICAWTFVLQLPCDAACLKKRKGSGQGRAGWSTPPPPTRTNPNGVLVVLMSKPKHMNNVIGPQLLDAPCPCIPACAPASSGEVRGGTMSLAPNCRADAPCPCIPACAPASSGEVRGGGGWGARVLVVLGGRGESIWDEEGSTKTWAGLGIRFWF